MAKAAKRVVTKRTVTTVFVDGLVDTQREDVEEGVLGVTLELSQAEARTLRVILHHVGGCPATTARRYAQSMILALDEAGVRAPQFDTDTLMQIVDRALYFNNSSLPYVEGNE